MVEPTLKDVLNAIAEVRRETADVRREAADIRRDMTTKGDLARLEATMERRFDALDEELTVHTKVHKEIEKDITALKGRPPRTAARPARRGRAR